MKSLIKVSTKFINLRFSKSLIRNKECLFSTINTTGTHHEDPNTIQHTTTTTTNNNNNTNTRRETTIHTLGDKNNYDAVKQLRLVELPDESNPKPNLLASIHVKRNIIFGTRVYDMDYLRMKGDEEINKYENNEIHDDAINYHNYGFVKMCKPLLKECLDQAGIEGDQPQGLAALHGLSAYIRYLIENPSHSKVMEQLITSEKQNDQITFDAISCVAFQRPRDGHDTLGLGTYLDARNGWTELSKEYALKRAGNNMIKQGEAQLFQSHGAVLVGIEYIGEENPNYWIDSGGAMARFIFL